MMRWDDMMRGNDGFWGGSGGVGVVLMVLIWVTVVALAVWAVVRLAPGRTGGSALPESPRAVLDRRLALGEIDAEEYARLRRLVESRAVPEDVKPPAAK